MKMLTFKATTHKAKPARIGADFFLVDAGVSRRLVEDPVGVGEFDLQAGGGVTSFVALASKPATQARVGGS
ncbi:hypothetical protein [Streptomyces sp. NPDC097610]|uniref:hypothetical protein n=1 Tax=Streptomyces sp. NPDC097610 TaxID=3157227 RepID=UPI00331F5C7B